MVKWTEVDAYSGMPVKEDAPTNFAGAGSKVAMPPDAMMKKKKKKTFLDARTKEYKEHQKRLEAARQRREERRKQAAKINEGQLDEREKSIDALPRQFLNPSKEIMIVKKNQVIVIDKKDKDKYMRQGWELAEEEMMEVNVTFIKKFAADMKKDKQFKPYADKFMKLAMKGGSPRDALEKAVPDFIAGKDIEKLISKNRMSNIFGEEKPKTFTQKVQEQIGGFTREAFLAENNMDVIKSIVKSQGAKDIKMKDGKLKMDYFTASAISKVHDKVNPTNKKKMEDLANGRKADLMKLQALALKFVK